MYGDTFFDVSTHEFIAFLSPFTFHFSSAPISGVGGLGWRARRRRHVIDTVCCGALFVAQ
jgi:hypothetical protein